MEKKICLLIFIGALAISCSQKKISKKDKFVIEKRYNTAISYLNKGLADLAEVELKSALPHNPKDAKLYSALGQVYLLKKKFNEAILFFDKAIKLDKEFNDPYYYKGNIFMVQKKWDEAILEYTKIVYAPFFRSPHNLYNSLGLAYYEKGNYQSAIENFFMALKFKNNFPLVHYNLGLTYLQIGKISLAIKEYESAITYLDSYTGAYNQLGLIYLKLGEKEKAIKKFSKVISLNPDRKIANQAKKYLHILECNPKCP